MIQTWREALRLMRESHTVGRHARASICAAERKPRQKPAGTANRQRYDTAGTKDQGKRFSVCCDLSLPEVSRTPSGWVKLNVKRLAVDSYRRSTIYGLVRGEMPTIIFVQSREGYIQITGVLDEDSLIRVSHTFPFGRHQ